MPKSQPKTDYVYTNLDELLVSTYNCLSIGRQHLFMNTQDDPSDERWMWLYEMDICLNSIRSELEKRGLACTNLSNG